MSAFYDVSAPSGALLVWPEVTNHSCAGGECAMLEALGPPPDMILTLPPPPLPVFLAESAPAMMNRSCGLCRWATGGTVDYVEMPRQGPAIDDTWFFVIICACVGLTLLGILLTIFCLRLKEQKKNRLGMDSADTNKPPLGAGQCEAVLYPPTATAGSVTCRPSRALWAGLRTRENHYTIEHVQPMEQKAASVTASSFEFPDDYSSVGYTAISPQAYRAGIPENVHILPAHDNAAYATAGEAMQVTRVAPDGCVVTASPRSRGQRTDSYPLRHRGDEQQAAPPAGSCYDERCYDERCYEEHCYEEPMAGRPLAPDERYQTPVGIDLSLHIYEKPQFRSASRSPKNRPKLLNSLSRNSPRPRRAASSMSNSRNLECRQLPPLTGGQHRRGGTDDGTEDGHLLRYTPPPAPAPGPRLNVSYPSPVV